MSKTKKFLLLCLWLLILSFVYWGFGNTEYTMFITYAYFAVCLILSVLFVLVNGGFEPYPKPKESPISLKPVPKHIHPVKAKDRYRTAEKPAPPRVSHEIPEPTRPNPLKIPEKHRYVVSQWVMILLLPFYVIFLLDWVLLHFNLL